MKWYGILSLLFMIGILVGVVFVGTNTDKFFQNSLKIETSTKIIDELLPTTSNTDKDCKTGERNFVYTNCEYSFEFERPSNQWVLFTSDDASTNKELLFDEEATFSAALLTISKSQGDVYDASFSLDVYDLSTFDHMPLTAISQSYVEIMENTGTINEIKLIEDPKTPNEFLIYFSNYDQVYFDCYMIGYRTTNIDYILQSCIVESLNSDRIGQLINETKNIDRSFKVI